MVDMAAKWGNILYEDARRDIGNVAVESATVQKLFEQNTPTPGVKTVTGGKVSTPSVLKKSDIPIVQAIDAISVIPTALVGTREEKAEAAFSLLPYEVDVTEVTAPEYKSKITYTEIDTPIGKIKVPKVDFGGETYISEEGIRTENVTVDDFVRTVKAQNPEDFISDVIDINKDISKEGKDFWETRTLGLTNIEIPDISLPSISLPGFSWPDIGGALGKIGKWILILSGVGLAAWILVSLFKGR